MKTIEAIALRQSTRSYKPEQISEDELQTLLTAGYAAPVGMGAYDSLNLTVVQNSDLLAKVTEAAATFYGNPKANPLYGAPTLIIVSSTVNEKAPSIGLANGSCIVENMSLASTDLGLGSVYLMGAIMAINTNEELLKELALPEGFVPVCALAVGYPTKPLEEKANKHHIKTNIIK